MVSSYIGGFLCQAKNHISKSLNSNVILGYTSRTIIQHIVGEDGDLYIFHRVTHSKTSGGKKNWKIDPNPLLDFSEKEMHIVKAEQVDKKSRFSPFKLNTKRGIDIQYPNIKRMPKKKK